MRDIPFEKTVMGRELIERRVPEALAELKKLRLAAERIAAALEAQAAPSRPEQEGGR